LFGQTFPVLSIAPRAAQGGFVFVTYRENITHRIPFSATNLAENQDFPNSKLTLASLEELVSLAKESGLICHAKPLTIGKKRPTT
jgi:hypothetical protein